MIYKLKVSASSAGRVIPFSLLYIYREASRVEKIAALDKTRIGLSLASYRTSPRNNGTSRCLFWGREAYTTPSSLLLGVTQSSREQTT
jgi:hypothetical protein